jgi:hypothetical protein
MQAGDEGGRGARAVFIYLNAEAIEHKEITRTASREYPVWMARSIGGSNTAYLNGSPRINSQSGLSEFIQIPSTAPTFSLVLFCESVLIC